MKEGHSSVTCETSSATITWCLNMMSYDAESLSFFHTILSQLVGWSDAITFTSNTAVTLCQRINKRCTYHGNEATNELKVLEVIRVDVGRRVDLQTVVVLASVLKQTVHGVQHLMREQEKPFPESTTTGQTRGKWMQPYRLHQVWCLTFRVIQEDAVTRSSLDITWPHLHSPAPLLQGR